MDLKRFQSRFSERVRALRVARGLRQEDLEDYGLSWKAVQKFEYGDSDPKVSSLLKLCTAFGVGLTELLSFDQPLPRRAQPEAMHERPPRRYGEPPKRKKKK